MKTYIRLIYNSQGPKPSDIYKILKDHNFVPVVGEYDFVYDWGEDREPEMTEILNKLDSFHKALTQHNVIYEVTTSDPMYHIKELTPSLSGAKATEALRSLSPSKPEPPSPTTEEVEICPSCSGEGTYVQQYDRWYCRSCKKYIKK
jgi:hypothetical protein